MMLLGRYSRRLDQRGRVVIPVDLRHSSRIYMVPGRQAGTLAVYYEQQFFAAPRPRCVYAYCATARMDRRGRIRIPAHLCRRVGLTRRVSVCGAGDHIVIISRRSNKELRI